MTLQAVVEYCQRHVGAAMEYLSSRGVAEESIQKFKLGYCPFDIDGLVVSVGRSRLVQDGIAFETDEGDVRCFIRNTIAFPFINQYNDIVSISFRPMQSNEVIRAKNLRKYWHTSFEKNTFLYGLGVAIPAIRKQKRAIVVEGQFDTIISHQFGFTNTVSLGGTALTAQHIKTLTRFAKEIIVVFDGDAAGQKATEKTKQKEWEDISIKTANLPDGEDVDSLLQSYGKEVYQSLLSEATEIRAIKREEM